MSKEEKSYRVNFFTSEYDCDKAIIYHYLEYKFYLILSLISVMITVMIGIFFHTTKYNEIALHIAPLWRLLGVFTIIFTIIYGFKFAKTSIQRKTRRRWWNMGQQKVTAPPDWEGILDMLCNKECDPLEIKEAENFPDKFGKFIISKSTNNLLYITSIIIGIIYGILIDYIIFPRIPALFTKDVSIEKIASLSSNLTAFLALIAAAISIIFTYQQLRAKVRASSRQKWVIKVRSLLTGVLENIYEITTASRNHIHFDSFNRSRTHLELHLNPAEKDHRLLMLLIRACAFPKTKISNDQYTATQISKIIDKWREDRGIPTETPPYSVFCNLIAIYNGPSNRDQNKDAQFIIDNRDEIISFIFKLSHALLKREWERVRDTID